VSRGEEILEVHHRDDRAPQPEALRELAVIQDRPPRRPPLIAGFIIPGESPPHLQALASGAPAD
jgi:hypothetical protein